MCVVGGAMESRTRCVATASNPSGTISIRETVSEEGSYAIATLGRGTSLRSYPRASSSSSHYCPLHSPSFRVLAPPSTSFASSYFTGAQHGAAARIQATWPSVCCSHFRSSLALTSNPHATLRFPFLIPRWSAGPLAPVQRHADLPRGPSSLRSHPAGFPDSSYHDHPPSPRSRLLILLLSH